MSDVTVSAAEIEKFKRERHAELEFLEKLHVLVIEFQGKVGVTNSCYRSIVRFLNAHRG